MGKEEEKVSSLKNEYYCVHLKNNNNKKKTKKEKENKKERNILRCN